MTDYVVGFAFDQHGSVALIHKERPSWQKGRWNGLGGHIEEGETGSEAMAREFLEETGMSTAPSDWRHAGQLRRSGVFICLVYTAVFPELLVTTKTDEMVRVFQVWEQATLGNWLNPCISNIPALLALTRMPPDSQCGASPMFDLDYTDK